jgi:murein DD-endopeptidase MepM/ murein hydrolase activator NlpD
MRSSFAKLLLVVSIAALFLPIIAEAARRQRPSRSSGSKTVTRATKAKVPAKKQAKAPAKKQVRAKRTVAVESAKAGTRGATEEHVHVRRGDTLHRLLTSRGLSPREAEPWLTAAASVYDPRSLRPRRGLTFRFDRATRELETVHYEIDERSLLVLERAPDGTIQAQRTKLPYFTEVKGVAGPIERGLREDATDWGIPPQVVSELAEIFGWEMDLENDLRPGDQFRILYENTWQAGQTRAEPGKVLGAEIATQGRSLTAVFFEDPDGKGGYYRPSGEAVSRTFLRYPVEFTEITSDFSLHRRHPILRIRRPHLGVDFAAPAGTPVRAVASGTVTESGWVNQLGRCVRIDHSGALASSYGHLARIAPGITAGKVVERGQVIGYVGSTGLATGPHLHFALDRDGQYVDPLQVTAASDTVVPDAHRRAFERVQTAVTRQLAALPMAGNPTTVSLFDEGAALPTLAE